MTGEAVTYKGIPTCNVITKCLELQQWILDPTSIPYDIKEQSKQKLIARSAGTSSSVENEEKRLTVDKQLELQQMILGD